MKKFIAITYHVPQLVVNKGKYEVEVRQFTTFVETDKCGLQKEFQHLFDSARTYVQSPIIDDVHFTDDIMTNW